MSIIEEAIKVKNDPDYEVLPNNPHWRCLSFTFEGHLYEVAFESDHYGDHARQFMVDGNWISPVQDKYWEPGFKRYPQFVTFSQCNSLLGVREFENGSINQDFLFTPLRLKEPNYKDGYRSEFFFLKTHLESIGVEVHEWTY